MSIDKRISLEQRFSFLNLESQVKKKFRITIVGHEKRSFSEDRQILYYVIKFQTTFPKDVYLLSYIEFDNLLKL